MFQRKLDVDILVYGNTHHYDAFEMDGKLFINPGTATGAFSTTSPYSFSPFLLFFSFFFFLYSFSLPSFLFFSSFFSCLIYCYVFREKTQPSFMVMIVQKTKVSCFIYKADENGNVFLFSSCLLVFLTFHNLCSRIYHVVEYRFLIPLHSDTPC